MTESLMSKGRGVEIVVAAVAALLLFNVVRSWWPYLAGSAEYGPPGEPSGPATEVYIVELGFMAVLGLLAVLLDRDSASTVWGRITWFVAGMLTTLSIVERAGIGSSVLLAALALLVAALLAGARRKRGKIVQAAHFGLGAIMQGFVVMMGSFLQNPGF